MIGQDEVFERIADAPWASQKLNITIGGAGGLGSWLALFLSRVGHSLEVYDFDVVGVENVGGGQFYKSAQAGTHKTQSLRNNIFEFTGHMGFTGMPRFEKGDLVQSVVFTTFDNMEARKDMLETWLTNTKNGDYGDRLKLFVNISMLPEGGFIEVIDRPSRAQRWLNEWQPSHEIPDLACTFKSTTHNAALMAAYALNMLNGVIFNKELGEDLRYVPYRTTVDLNLLMLETDA